MARIQLLIFLLILVMSLTSCESKKTSQAASEKPNPVFSLGNFERVKGTDVLMADVFPKDDPRDEGLLSKIGSGSSYGDSSPDTYNLIFLNLKDNSFTQLFPTNDYLISHLYPFPTKANDGNEPNVEFFIYRIIKADTNNDQKLNAEDKVVLAISEVNGAGFTELIDGIGSVYAQEMKDANTLTIVYWKESKRWISNIDVRNKKVMHTAELPEFTKPLN